MSYINIGDLTGGKQDYWSWANLNNFVGQDEAAEHFYAGESSSVVAYSYFCRLAIWSCQGMPSCVQFAFAAHSAIYISYDDQIYKQSYISYI